MARRISDTFHHFSGSANGFLPLVEVDFAAASGAAYVPPERGNFRRIVPERTIQLLQDATDLIHTYQTSAAYIRLPSNQLGTDETGNDAGDGRHLRFKNEGVGAIYIGNSAGILLVTVPPLYSVELQSSNNQQWDVYSLSNENPNALPISSIPFTRGGGVSENAYLYTGNNLTSDAGYPVKSISYITSIAVTNKSLMAAGRSATFRLQNRTGLNTFVDIPGSDITIPSGAYSAFIDNILIQIGPNWELCCYRINGGGGGGGVNGCSLNYFTI